MKKFIDINIFNIFKKYFLYIRIQTDLVDGAVPLIEVTRPRNVITTFAAFYKTNNRWMTVEVNPTQTLVAYVMFAKSV